MCGISAILLCDRTDQGQNEQGQNECENECKCEDKLYESMNALRHRGYDGCGLLVNTRNGEIYRRRLLNKHGISTNEDSNLNSNPNSNSNPNPNNIKIIIKNDEFYNQCRCRNSLGGEKHQKFQNTKHQPSRYQDTNHQPSRYQPSIFGIAHTRYKTAGECEIENTQPIMNENGTLALVHNGQVEIPVGEVPVGGVLVGEKYSSDSKYILDMFERFYKDELHGSESIDKTIFKTIVKLNECIRGSYACILLIKNIGLVAFRDPNGIRPMVFGIADRRKKINGPNKQSIDKTTNIMFASESVVLTTLGYQMVRDVKPGEAIFVDVEGNINYFNTLSNNTLATNTLSNNTLTYKPCLFEYIYLAHESSVIDGIKVHRARMIMAELMYEKLKLYSSNLIDALVPIPNTPVSATKHLSALSKIKYVDLLSLPLYLSDRTFILPTQNKREMAVQQKFRINSDRISQCRGKTIALVDDSIVRGTTTKILIKLIRHQVQPRKIILISLAPLVRYKNIYGIDIPDCHDLVAHNRTLGEIAVQLGADDVMFGDILKITNRLLQEAHNNGVPITGFESSVFISSKK